MYRIGQLAKLTGVTSDTLRYYEKHQLMTPARRSESGYRLYTDAAVQQIQFIQRAKRVGFTLKGISELLSLKVEKGSHSCEQVKTLTENKLHDVERKLEELQNIKQALLRLNAACCGGAESAEHCSILNTLETGKDMEVI
ncbi:MAG: Zn(2+)-responsive transcriptional regulator [Pseudomonadales bacterium]|nr:Zn(2+)-responsive transcriptional regulator [Pseudomonadales bacterium]